VSCVFAVHGLWVIPTTLSTKCCFVNSFPDGDNGQRGKVTSPRPHLWEVSKLILKAGLSELRSQPELTIGKHCLPSGSLSTWQKQTHWVQNSSRTILPSYHPKTERMPLACATLDSIGLNKYP
jgi:hypothetical protein